MYEWILIGCLGLLALVGVMIACYPLRQYKLSYLLSPFAFLGLVVAYSLWGDYFAWQQYVDQIKKQAAIQALLQSPNKTAALIEKIRRQLNQTPKSAQGWYLLGKLYLTQKNYSEARKALEIAYQLQPDSPQIALFYVRTLWEFNHQQFNPQMREILQNIIKRDAHQPDALAMLAMDAYQEKDLSLAIEYWQRLLVIIPQESEEREAILQAIQKAKKQLKN